jgi:transketolase N-terminal domain/subunit
MALAIIAIYLSMLSYKRLAAYQKKASLKGIVLSVLAGLFIAPFYTITMYGMDPAFGLSGAGTLTPYSGAVFFALGAFLSTFIFNPFFMARPVQGAPVKMSEYFKGSFKSHFWGVLGGSIWMLGMVVSFMSSGEGSTIAYALSNAAPVVAILWGVLVWKEFKGAPERNQCTVGHHVRFVPDWAGIHYNVEFIEMHKKCQEVKELNKKAVLVRRRTVEIIGNASGGHIGGSLSSVDILVALHFAIMNIDPNNPEMKGRDRFIMSKGHSVESYYSTLESRGFITSEMLDTYGQFNSILAGHPTRKVPGIELNSGALGHGLSVGVGLALAAKRSGESYMTYVLMGDGEHGEGSIMEAAASAGHYKLNNLVAYRPQPITDKRTNRRGLCH